MAEIKRVRMQGVFDAQKVEERDYREVPGTEDVLLEGALAVARGGAMKEGDAFVSASDFEMWPHVLCVTEDGMVKVDMVTAVALTWLTPSDRAAIRDKAPAGTKHSDKAIIDPLVAEYNVWKHAIAKVANTPEEELTLISPGPGSSVIEGDVHELTGATVDSYKAYLYEFSRPPSRGGNTSALHTHVMEIDGEKYSFFARGTKKWVFKGDTCSFNYVITPEGHRNVLRHTVVTYDKKGERKRRGDRRHKAQLRSSPGQ